MCFWKAISNGWDRFLQFVSYKVGDGLSIKFWTDRWCGETSLKVRFPDLYRIARHKDASVRDLMSYKSSTLQWDVCFVCRVQDWEVDTITVFMDLLYSVKIRQDEADALCWNPSSRDIIGVKSFYKVLQSGAANHFPWKAVWKSKTPKGELLSLDSSVGEGAHYG